MDMEELSQTEAEIKLIEAENAAIKATMEAENAAMKATMEAEDAAMKAENAAIKATLEAIREQLSIFDSLILYPTYQKKLDCYGGAEKDMVELAMKANFFKTSHEIRKRIRTDMKDRHSKRHCND
ncbi:uncharacterized protein LOC131073481 [Cryptomeria japonica]|uniref:uncharacterized protein LOC131073481 n=1 Tax=Cryptomeria japonica TaxID=3369 RepID=UPI0027DAA746|nr:uncharacterized protein LOC131073481 [Cryptomeria japonica]